ncbi:hypothetical protein K8O92_25655 [Nocardia asteroides]|nr:hypothetical protein K8O92_25655 [Nocardia asteroides]
MRIAVRRAISALLVAGCAVPVAGVAAAEPVASSGPGTIVSSRSLEATELIPAAGEGYRLVCRTTGRDGEPAAPFVRVSSACDEHGQRMYH